MAGWPDINEAKAYVGEVNGAQVPVLEQCLAAAVEYIDWRCVIEMTEGDDEADPPVLPEPIVPATVHEATLMLTSRLFRRRLSPEGVSDFGEFGAVRVSRVDPDIERMITPARSWGFA